MLASCVAAKAYASLPRIQVESIAAHIEHLLARDEQPLPHTRSRHAHEGNTILITGGGTGIGLAFAKRFVSRGNHVIICGRRADHWPLPRMKTPPCRYAARVRQIAVRPTLRTCMITG